MRIADRSSAPQSRRVVIKTRLVILKRVVPHSTKLHLSYIERDGVTTDGKPGRAYGPDADDVDTQKFETKGRNDRHQFRFIVSSENATELGDLKGFTRDLMTQMEKDLGTRLDWVAVDHWDTENPHTHIVLRGVDTSGENLVIARDYISYGMRQRASEVITEWLGPRTSREIQESLTREMTQERWTNLDRDIQHDARQGLIDLRVVPVTDAERARRSLKIGRLQQLDKMGLAQESATGLWHINSRAENFLRAMGERGDIIRTMQRTFTTTRREFVVVEPRELKTNIVGRVAAKGLADELTDRQYLIVDGIDGKGHYIVLPEKADVTGLPVGGIVEVRAGSRPRAVDQTIVTLANEGIYRAEKHLEKARASAIQGQKPEAFVAAHERRLEALRRAGIVERVESGVWRVPPDLPIKGREYDAKQIGGVDVQLASHLPIEKQIRAIGATWLDHQLAKDPIGVSESGFGSETRSALRQRLAFLVDEGFADRRATKIVLRGNLLASLRERELDGVSKSISAESGLTYRRASNGQRVSGIYRRTLMLNSGRFAMIDDGSGFSLVPWRPVIERHLGREVRGIVNGSNISWDLSKTRGLNP
jgi:type IV secretory pathway VirD2 relaxase